MLLPKVLKPKSKISGDLTLLPRLLTFHTIPSLNLPRTASRWLGVVRESQVLTTFLSGIDVGFQVTALHPRVMMVDTTHLSPQLAFRMSVATNVVAALLEVSRSIQ
jgi:hypothetical protein